MPCYLGHPAGCHSPVSTPVLVPHHDALVVLERRSSYWIGSLVLYQTAEPSPVVRLRVWKNWFGPHPRWPFRCGLGRQQV